MKRFLACILLIALLLTAGPLPAGLAADLPVVHAVLFYSPSCGHCHLVITETLPPLFEKYGEQLNLVGVDISQPAGQTMFMATLQHFNLESGGVPFLVIGDTYLVGSIDIPQKFPGLIEQYLAQGGIGWPNIPGFAEALAASENSQEQTSAGPTPASAANPTDPPAENTTSENNLALPASLNTTVWERLARDPAGNILAIIFLAGMIGLLVWVILNFRKSPHIKQDQSHTWIFPLLCLAGLVVAGYMAYVETAQVEAVCGPVGDCNTVQQSEYARLFGVLPIGLLGVAGYILILAAWYVERTAHRKLAAYAALALLGLTGFGLLFSIYLTFLEPFVIGATCAWCLTSAVLMSALFWFSLAPARRVA